VEKLINLNQLKSLVLQLTENGFPDANSFEQFCLVETLTLKKSIKNLLRNLSIFLCVKKMFLKSFESKNLSNLCIPNLALLQELHVTDSDLNDTKNLDLRACLNLTKIFINNNSLNTVRSDLLLCHENMKELHLMSNEIDIIDANSFSNLPGLEHLNICMNLSDFSVKRFAFNDARNLVSLSFISNGIEDMKSSLFVNNLKALTLHLNHYVTNEIYELAHLNQLEFLCITENQNLELRLNELVLPNLKFLLLQNPSVPNVSNFPNLQGVIIIGLIRIEPGVFNCTNCLDYVDLRTKSYDEFDRMNEEHFLGLSKLEFLQLSYTKERGAEETNRSSDDSKRSRLADYLKKLVESSYSRVNFRQIRIYSAQVQDLKNYFEKKLNVSTSVKSHITRNDYLKHFYSYF
jgi:hypothetical protein